MAEQLTKNFFENLCRHGKTLTLTPTLQVLAGKEMQPPQGAAVTSKRLRLSLSDGGTIYTVALLTVSSNADFGFDPSELPVIRVNDFTFKPVTAATQTSAQPAKCCFHISSLTVLSKPGNRLGDPVAYVANQSSLLSAQPPPATARPGAMNEYNTAGGGGTVNAAPRTGYATKQLPANVQPVTALTPYQNKWKIRVRVTMRSDVKHWSNARGEGKFFTMDLADESGEIRATAFKAECDKYNSLLQQGHVYYISGGQIKQANKKFTSIKNDYELTFSQQTEVQECFDQSVADIPTQTYNFVKFDQLEKNVGQVVDILGVVRSIGDTSTINIRAQNRDISKRELQLVDDTNRALTLTLWGDKAEQFPVADLGEDCIMALKACNVKEFQGGVSVSAGQSTQYDMEPDIQQCHSLRAWWDQNGKTDQFTSLSSSKPSTNMAAKVKLIAVADEALKLGHDEATDYFDIRCMINVLNRNNDNFLYKACPTDNCNKKLLENGPGDFNCTKCNASFDRYKYRAMLSVNVCDFSGTHWVTLFSEGVEQLLGRKVDDLGTMFENGSTSELDSVFEAVTFQRFQLRIRAKTERYNDEARVKWTVHSVRAVDVQAEMDMLTQAVNTLNQIAQ